MVSDRAEDVSLLGPGWFHRLATSAIQMHGLVHVVFKSFVVENFGTARWQEILEKAGVVDESAFLALEQQEDELTLTAVTTACEVLAVPVDTALELFGAHFFDFVYDQGNFSRLLHSIGPTLRDLLSNLNALHHNIERDIPAAIFPHIEIRHDGAPTDGQGPTTLYLSYTSVRGSVLAPLLRGLLCRLAEVMFSQHLTFTELDNATHARGLDGPAKEWAEAGKLPPTTHRQRLVWRLQLVDIVCNDHQDSDDQDVETDNGESTVKSAISSEAPAVVRLRSSSPSKFYPRSMSLKKGLGLASRRYPTLLIHSVLASCCSSKMMDAVISPLPVARSSPVQEPAPEIRRVFHDKRQRVLEVLDLRPPSSVPSFVKTVGSYPDMRAAVAQALFRAAPAAMVSAEWTDFEALRKAREFWSLHSKLGVLYASHSVDAFEGTRGKRSSNQVLFVSHCWAKPERWEEVMGPSSDYAETKAAEVCIAAKDMAYATWGDSTRWREINLWVDKCCIPQQYDPQLREYSVHLIEEFIQFSDGLIVQLSWNYFTRLWCVYEWACFLRFHDITDITLCVDPYLREGSFPLLLDAIRTFRLADCDCTEPADRDVVYEKVATYFSCSHAFERLVKFSAISLVARSLVERRHGTSSVFALLKPWADLAKELQFHDLHLALLTVVERVPVWRDEVVREVQKSCPTTAVQGSFNMKVASWFSADIKPLVLNQLHGAVKNSNSFFNGLSSEAIRHKVARARLHALRESCSDA